MMKMKQSFPGKVCLLVLFVICTATQLFAQKVAGVVVDESNTPMPGVNVVIKGTTNGVITNSDGSYAITAGDPQKDVLSFSFIGFETKEISINGGKVINVQLKSSTLVLDEIVAVGYGVIKKNDLTGSVGTVSSDLLVSKGTTSVLSALQGTIAGVNITTNSVRPGGSSTIRIRGQNSIEAGNPLYVVDGVVTGDIEFLNPADIDRIDVLKDASSTAIYGSRGSNGVILVKTKGAGIPKGTKTTITYDGYSGVRDLTNIPNFMSGTEWVDFRTSAFYTYDSATKAYTITEANKTAILQKSPLLEKRLYNKDYEDWLGLATQQGKQQNHYINISGNSKDMAYNLGVGYQNEVGNFIKESLDRYSLKGSIFHKVSDFFSTGGSFNMSQTVTNSGSQYGYRDVLRMPSILKAYDDNGVLIDQPGIATSIQGAGNFTSSPNPLKEINSGNQEIRRYDVIGNMFIQINPIAGLELKSTLSPRLNKTRTGKYYGIVSGNRTKDYASSADTEAFEYTWDNQITYNTTIKDVHHINASFINSLFKSRYELLQAASEGLPYNSEWYNLFSGTLVPGDSKSNYTETTLLSYATRINYDYRNKYLFTGTLRYDGSSKLADKWAAFPSLALAWRLSEENFMKADFLSNLKARFSFGYSGNNNGISPFGTQLTPQTSANVYYDYNGTLASGFAPGYPVNQAITWEKTREFNFGIDYGFFNNRITGTVDLYDKLSDGLLMSRTLSIESGVPSMKDNIGSVSNKGIEVSLNTVNVRTDNLEWSTSFTFAYNKNAIETLYGKKQDVMGEARFIGQPINVIYDYRIIGVWKSTEAVEAAKWGEQPGQAIAEDISKDGVITAAKDRVILGSPDPTWTGSITSELNYKNWDFSFNIYTRQGSFVKDEFLGEFGSTNTQRGRPKIVSDYFIPTGIARYDWNAWDTSVADSPKAVWGVAPGNENAKYPAPNNAGPYYGSNGQYTDASFIKVKNISLGYSLPKKLISKVKMSQLRLYVNVLNPFVITDYEGWDPEYATTSLQNGNGPANVTYQFGVNVKF
jgi:TonB-linked SusC/RagA family outer membrane protein